MKYAWSAGEAWAKTTAALIGGAMLFVAVFVCAGIVLTRAGVSRQASATWAVWLAFVTWPVAATAVLLARDGRRAWIATAAVIAVMLAAAYGARFL